MRGAQTHHRTAGTTPRVTPVASRHKGGGRAQLHQRHRCDPSPRRPIHGERRLPALNPARRRHGRSAACHGRQVRRSHGRVWIVLLQQDAASFSSLTWPLREGILMSFRSLTHRRTKTHSLMSAPRSLLISHTALSLASNAAAIRDSGGSRKEIFFHFLLVLSSLLSLALRLKRPCSD